VFPIARRVIRDDQPAIEVILTRDAFEDLGSLPDRLREILLHPERPSAVIDRLFPKAHDTPKDQIDHRRLIGLSLYEERLENMRRFEAALGRDRRFGPFLVIRLDIPEAHLWLHVINDFRLLLATELGIQDNEWHETPPADDDELESFTLLELLSGLQVALIDVLPP
jgi:hypothetical protein